MIYERARQTSSAVWPRRPPAAFKRTHALRSRRCSHVIERLHRLGLCAEPELGKPRCRRDLRGLGCHLLVPFRAPDEGLTRASRSEPAAAAGIAIGAHAV